MEKTVREIQKEQNKLSGKDRDYYIRNEKKIHKEFKALVKVARKVALNHYDPKTIDAIIIQAYAELEKILPTLPYVGGNKSPFTTLMISSAETIAFYKACKTFGLTPREMGKFIYEIAESYAESIPSYKKWLARKILFTGFFKNRWKKWMAENQKREYPENWHGEYIVGDGISFNYGLNFNECAWMKLARIVGAEDISPYVCLSDYAKMRAIGVGFKRTQTLVAGAPMCDFRFVKHYQTPRGWPPEKLEENKEFYAKLKE